MERTGELWMELTGSAILVGWMEYREETVRSLAAKCPIRDPKTGQMKLLATAVIGHLRCGRRRTCTIATAKAIEKALKAPPGLLFVPKVARAAA